MNSIKNIVMPDDTPCASVQEAVEKFKCPGPCDPDCGLYRTVRIRNGIAGHMCHPEIVARYPTAVLDAMRCSYDVSIENSAPARYAAVIRSGAVRDIQFCRTENTDPISDDWEDLEDAEVWLGFFRGPGALEKAATYGRTIPENIRLIPVDPDMKED